MKKKIILLTAVATALTISASQGQILDTFDSGTRADLGYVANNTNRSGFSAEVSGGNLVWTRVAQFAPWVLAKSFSTYDLSTQDVGSSIELSFCVTASGFTNWGRNFWFGIYNNPNAPLSADVGWINDSSFHNYSGYFARVATGAHTTSQLTGGVYGATTVGSASSVTWEYGAQDNVFSHGLGDGVQNYYWLELVKNSDSEYTLSLWHNSVNDKGTAILLASVMTAGGTLNTGGAFNTLVFSTEGEPAGTLSFDYVTVAVSAPSAPAPRIACAIAGGNTEVSFPSVNGILYQLQVSTGLDSWTDVPGQSAIGDGGQLTLSDPAPGSGDKAFYRVRTE